MVQSNQETTQVMNESGRKTEIGGSSVNEEDYRRQLNK